MVTKIKTAFDLAQCEAIAKRIISANGHNKGLMQDASIMAIEHLAQHGNINILAPLYEASKSFGRNLTTAWRNYIVKFTWLEFNPNDLRGTALNKAAFTEVFVKGGGKMDVDGAKGAKWYDAKADNTGRDAGEYNAPDSVARFFDRAIKALIADKAVGADGKRVTMATVRKMVIEQLDRMDKEVTAGIKAKVPVAEITVTPKKAASAPGKLKAPTSKAPAEPAPIANVA